MATEFTKKDILLGQTIDEVVQNTNTNFDTLFNYADDVEEILNTKANASPDGKTPLISNEGKINTTYLPDTVLGQVEYKGTFSAANGVNQVGEEGASTGWYYICIASGNYNPDGSEYNKDNNRDENAGFQSGGYEVGDWAIYNYGIWDKVDNTDAVTLVNGQKGSVQTYKGSYTPGTTYYRGDQVLYENCLYLYIYETPSTTAPSDTSGNYWKIYGRVYSNASDTTAGLIKVSSVNQSKVTVNSESTTEGRYYPVELNGDGKAIVNVPWTDTNTDTNQTIKVKKDFSDVGFGSNDVITLEAGDNVTIAPDAANKKITISAKDTTYNEATESTAGLMSAADKAKLNDIDASLLEVTADDIGKVKDVIYNGSSILNARGEAVIPTIVIEDLQSEYTTVTANVSKTLNGTTYYGFNVAKTDAAFEVYNSSGQQIVTQKVLDGDNLFIAVGTTSGQSVQIRKLTGGSVTNGVGSSGGVNLDAVYPVGSVFQTTVDLGYPSVGTWGYIGNSNGEEITINVSKRITLAVNTDEPVGAGYRAEYYDTIDANLSLSDLTFSPDDDSELSILGVNYNPSTGFISVECGYDGSESTVEGTLSYKITTKKYTYTRIS